MAHIYGTCGAWKSLLSLIERDLPDCRDPQALQTAVRILSAGLYIWPDQAREEIKVRVDELGRLISRHDAVTQKVVAETVQRVAGESALVEQRISELETAKLFFVRWYNRWLRLPLLRRRLNGLKRQPEKVQFAADRKIKPFREELQTLKADPEREVAKRVAAKQRKLDRLTAALESPDFSGAIGERQMAQKLSRGLSDDYHVFHDVHIEQSTWVYEDGEHRRSAQIDHLVVGPTGVFVIEHKLWSKRFARSGDYHDPYRQIRAAGKLCHFALSNRTGQKIRVREIIASAGDLPPPSGKTFAKVKSPGQVCRYIRYFDRELNDYTIRELVGILRGMC